MRQRGPQPSSGLFLVRFMLGHLLYGTVGAVVFGSLVLYFNVSGIWDLLSSSRDAVVFIFLFYFGLIVTFGGVSMGWGVMNIGGFSDDDRYRDERRDHLDE